MCEEESQEERNASKSFLNAMSSHEGVSIFGVRKITPERLLMVGVLEDALREYRDTHSDYAAKWLYDDSSDYLFSFVNICKELKLNVEILRRKIGAL